MGLFTKTQLETINKTAVKSKTFVDSKPSKSINSVNTELAKMTKNVQEYFSDSKAILITSKEDLHNYITKAIEVGYCGIDTETTGLDRQNDTIVGASLYYPGSNECYIPMKHLVPIFDEPYKNQLSYEEVGLEFQRFVDASTKMIFANADFDLAMIYKDLKVDMNDICFYDVILAWRCLKEDERDNSLKGLYMKYVMKGKGNPMKFSDFFSPKLFPYSKPDVAKLYAANDAKITYELFRWQLPYLTKSNPKCQKNRLESIADLVWNVEFPLIKICQNMHRTGMYIDNNVAKKLLDKYENAQKKETEKLMDMVSDILKSTSFNPSSFEKVPFRSVEEFNPKSQQHVKYLLYDIIGMPVGKSGQSTDKSILKEMNTPLTNQILAVRSVETLINSFVSKLPNVTTSDNRIHGRFNQIGARTGRMSGADPNLQNIPSKSNDIRHMFRATPGYVMISSDYSQQEPKLTAYVSKDKHMIEAFQNGKDIYATIASMAFHVPYEMCLENNPITGEYQPDGYKRRSNAKSIVLGITYGMSVQTIGSQIFGGDATMSDDDKTKEAQSIYDAVLNAFPNLKALMKNAQKMATKYGYVETILGRRRHIPEMQLKPFEFKALPNYVNPDIDPLDVETLVDKSDIPKRIVDELENEFRNYKYFGQIANRQNELYQQGIKVINNKKKITDASRKCVNSIIQGSAAEQTKMAILMLENNEEWKEIGGRLLVPVHDELIAEVPIDKWEEGGNLLKRMMLEAASFLPFDSKCDVTTTLRWYGVEYPCKYKKPKSLDDLNPDEIKWIQWHLYDLEYILPVYENEDGTKLKGDPAIGINGIYSDEMDSMISDYCNLYKISREDFIEHIDYFVLNGVLPDKNL